VKGQGEKGVTSIIIISSSISNVVYCSYRTFAVPKLTSGLLTSTFNPICPATARVFAKFRCTAVPVNGHEIDSIFVRGAGTENSWSEKTEFQLGLKESESFLVVTTAA